MRVSHETIYTSLFVQAKADLLNRGHGSEFTDSARQNNPKLLEHMRGTRLTGEVVDETELVPPQFPGFFVS